jgi:predicted aspartyl protease
MVNELTQVARALAELRTANGAEVRLGNANGTQAQVEAATERADKALAGYEFPLMDGGEHPRLGLLVNGQPATFLIDDANPQTVLPLDQAERLGLVTGAEALDDDSAWVALPYREVELRVRPAKLRTIRIGDVTLRDVAVFIIDQSHTDLGPRLGSDLIDQLDLQIDRGRAQIKIGRSSSAERKAVE